MQQVPPGHLGGKIPSKEATHMLRILKISLLVSVVVLLNAVTTLLFVQNAVPASAGPQCVNGDVNGDAAVDITDPIHLLSYIFEGGPEPVACAQQPLDRPCAILSGYPGTLVPGPIPVPGQSIPYIIAIDFNTIESNGGIALEPSGAVTVTEPGFYYFTFSLRTRFIYHNNNMIIRRNGIAVAEDHYDIQGTTGHADHTRSISTFVYLQSGDVVDFAFEIISASSSSTGFGQGLPENDLRTRAYGFKVSD